MRIEFPGQRIACVGEGRRCHRCPDEFRRRAGQQRPVADRKEDKAQIRQDISLDDRLGRKAGDGVIAVPARELMKERRGIFPRHRQFDGHQQFLRRQRSFIDAGEKIPRRDPALAGPSAHHDGRIERQHAGRQFRRRIALRQAAAERSAVADCRMGDVADRVCEQRRMPRNFRRARQIDMARQRSDPDRIADNRDAAQLGQCADVDDQFGGNQPEIHRRHQALATGQHFCPFAV